MALAARPLSTAGVAKGAATGSGGTVSYIVDIREVEEMIDAFTLATSGPSLMTWLQTVATEFFEEDIESRFNEEGDAKSGFWDPLSPTTIRIRESKGYGAGPINVRSGELEDFVTDHRDYAGGPDWASMDVPGEASNAELMRKLQVAQMGSPPGANHTYPSSSTPARPVLATSEMDLFKLLQLLGNYVVERAMTRVS